MSFDKLELGGCRDLVSDNIRRIGAVFPDCVVERRNSDGQVVPAIDFEVLKAHLSDSIIDPAQSERYQMNWPGKAESRNQAYTPIDKTLRPVVAESKDFDTTENIFIEGDNLDALKLLQESYLGKIKMIYIDPPYNTGKDFIYKDNRKQDITEYNEDSDYTDENGGRLVANPESNGRYHSDWLSMMYPRLLLARNLLTDDGVIFISIDDNEQANLKKLCDEIFGQQNLICQICHKSRASVSSDKIISPNHNFILLYAKNERVVFANRNIFGLEPNLDGFNHKDENGAYKLVPVDGPGGAKKGNPYYTFQGISGYWRFSKSTMEEKYKQETVVKKGKSLYQKLYKKDAIKKRRTITSWWDNKFYTSEATKKLNTMLGGNYFDTPKPVDLILQMIKLSTQQNDIILDFFAGSGTTAHAVMTLNAQDGGKRKCISVQLNEYTNPKSEAYKAGYKNIADITKERIRRAGDKIISDNANSKDPKDLSTLDTGFRVFKIDSGNYKPVQKTANQTTQAEIMDLVENIKSDRSDIDLLFDVLLAWGVQLDHPIEKHIFDDKTVYSVYDKNDPNKTPFLMACFAENITETMVTKMTQHTPHRVVFRDACFNDNDSLRINTQTLFKTYSPQTEIKVI